MGTVHWYLVHTKPASELTAEAHLTRQGYAVYLPRLLQPAPCGGSPRGRVVPLFPRYLFLRPRDVGQSLAPARSTVGVSGIVRFGLDYAVVSPSVIADLLRRADPQSGLHTLKPGRPFNSGDPVSLIAGPFGGLDGIFEQQAGHERVVILLRLLGREVAVCVPGECLAPREAA